MYLVILLVYFQHSSGETCHIRPQWFLLPLFDGEQVVSSPFWTLPAYETTNKGTAQLFEVINGRCWQLVEPLPSHPFESSREGATQNLIRWLLKA